MMNTINSHKHQEPVSYYTEDISYCGSGEYIAPGVGDMTGTEYDLIFDENGCGGYLLRDIVRHNDQ